MAQISPIQSFTIAGPDLGKANWWTNTSPSRSQMASAASMGATGMMGGSLAATSPGYGGPPLPRNGTFSNWATQRALAGQHEGLSALYEAYHQALAIGDIQTAEKIEQELRKYGYDPVSDRELNPTMAPLFGGFAPRGAAGVAADAAAGRARAAAAKKAAAGLP
jgi:hypothetical protein